MRDVKILSDCAGTLDIRVGLRRASALSRFSGPCFVLEGKGRIIF